MVRPWWATSCCRWLGEQPVEVVVDDGHRRLRWVVPEQDGAQKPLDECEQDVGFSLRVADGWEFAVVLSAAELLGGAWR